MLLELNCLFYRLDKDDINKNKYFKGTWEDLANAPLCVLICTATAYKEQINM